MRNLCCISNGVIAVPTAPGLGYEVDEAALLRCERPPPAGSKL
jgi:L-alanine-DL-glutamate epimerase-like enolase superfamily enzyme